MTSGDTGAVAWKDKLAALAVGAGIAPAPPVVHLFGAAGADCIEPAFVADAAAAAAAAGAALAWLRTLPTADFTAGSAVAGAAAGAEVDAEPEPR